jgi:hypothetical protein
MNPCDFYYSEDFVSFSSLSPNYENLNINIERTIHQAATPTTKSDIHIPLTLF